MKGQESESQDWLITSPKGKIEVDSCSCVCVYSSTGHRIEVERVWLSGIDKLTLTTGKVAPSRRSPVIEIEGR